MFVGLVRIMRFSKTKNKSQKSKVPVYVGRDAAGEITNHIVMARTKRKMRRVTVPALPGENLERPSLFAGLRRQFGKWGRILKDFLSGNLRIVQNGKKAETDSETEDNNGTIRNRCRKKPGESTFRTEM